MVYDEDELQQREVKESERETAKKVEWEVGGICGISLTTRREDSLGRLEKNRGKIDEEKRRCRYRHQPVCSAVAQTWPANGKSEWPHAFHFVLSAGLFCFHFRVVTYNRSG